MDDYLKRFEAHAVHKKITTLREALDSFEIPEDDPVTRDVITRFTRVSNFVCDSIGKSEPSFWTPTYLGYAQSIVAALQSAITQFQANKRNADLTVGGDTALDQIGQIFPLLGKTKSDGEEILAQYIKQVQSSLGSIDKHKERAKETESAIEAAETDFLKRLKATEKKLSDFDTQFETQKTRVDTLITEQQTVFTTKQESRVTEFTDLLGSWKKEYLLEKTKRGETFKASEVSRKNEASKIIKQITDQHDRAVELVGIIANTGLTGNYALEAKRDYYTAEIMRGLAMLFFLIAAVAVCWVVFTSNSASFDWRVALFRVGVGAALAVPAWYCAKESQAHRRSQRRNKRIQLELEAIEPYLERLDDDALRKQILKEKVNDYFGSKMAEEIALEERKSDGGNVTFSQKELLNLLPQITKILKQ